MFSLRAETYSNIAIGHLSRQEKTRLRKRRSTIARKNWRSVRPQRPRKANRHKWNWRMEAFTRDFALVIASNPPAISDRYRRRDRTCQFPLAHVCIASRKSA